MTRIFIRAVRSARRQRAVGDLASRTRIRLNEVMDSKVKPLVAGEFDKVVADWKHEVTFGARKAITPDAIKLYVFPQGENKEIFDYVDKGTREHPIFPRQAKALHFKGFKDGVYQVGSYEPKTLPAPGRMSGGPGIARGDEGFLAHVQHPGTEAREFGKRIWEDKKVETRRLIENALKTAAREAGMA